MYLKSLELNGFKSFAKKSKFDFTFPITSIVGPNGSGKSNVAEAFRFVLGEQSIKSMRGKRGEDLIFNGSKTANRMNRAAVKVVFDNTKRFLDIDFDEVTLERVVHRDGVNQYFINGSQVRLRDIVLLLASANIGSSGHHIISQGEADKILSSNLKERRETIEDALGLKVYQYKKQESERKLNKTKENISQIQSLRKEVVPHLRFLKKQVEQVEKTRSMREELKALYREYIYRERVYITHEDELLNNEMKEPQEELASLNTKLKEAKDVLEKSSGRDKKSEEVILFEEKLSATRKEKDAFTLNLGRLEGQIIFEEKRIELETKRALTEGEQMIRIDDVRRVADRIKGLLEEAEEEERLLEIQVILKKVKELLKDFFTSSVTAEEESVSETNKEELVSLEGKKDEMKRKIEEMLQQEQGLEEEYKLLRKEIEEAKDDSREAERAVFTIMSRQSELRAKMTALNAREDILNKCKRDFEEELHEGEVLVGQDIHNEAEKEVFQDENGEVINSDSVIDESRDKQEVRRKHIEKLKIRLEEFGSGAGEEIEKEYTEAKNRDEFLEREINDLEQSAESLEQLIKELEGKLNTQFREGIVKINEAFQRFFVLMFGGGKASLSIVKEKKRRRVKSEDEHTEISASLKGEEEIFEDEEEEIEEGIDILVSLPHKKIKGLHMLSGGERALTSIALLFAMSQINPPPFIVLDETDAALDEANSRRYGDMIQELCHYSQLILITHNRETMSRAGILYGVTMGADGISKLLSVQFDEAVEIAK